MARVESNSRGFERERDRRHDRSPDTGKKDWHNDDGEDGGGDSCPSTDRFGACRTPPPRQAPKSFRNGGGSRAPGSACGRLTQQPVPGATHGRDAVWADLVAQVAHVDVHHVG